MRTSRGIVQWLALAAMATVAGAQMMGGAGQGMGMGGAMLRVATNGTALVLRPAFAGQATTPSGMELVAMTPSGSVAWRKALGFGMHDLEIAGSLVVLSEVEGMGWDGSMGNPSAAKSNIVALELASGVEAWTTTLDGVAMSIETDSNRVYVEIVKPSSTGNGHGNRGGGMHGGGGNGGGNGGMNGGWMNGAFSLVALGLDGQILWSERIN